MRVRGNVLRAFALFLKVVKFDHLNPLYILLTGLSLFISESIGQFS